MIPRRMPLFERDSDTWGIAARIIRERIVAMPEYAEARELVKARAIERCRGKSIAAMREIGGFSGALADAIRELPGRFRQQVGSPLLPSTVASQLDCYELPELRFEVQRHLANELQAPRLASKVSL